MKLCQGRKSRDYHLKVPVGDNSRFLLALSITKSIDLLQTTQVARFDSRESVSVDSASQLTQGARSGQWANGRGQLGRDRDDVGRDVDVRSDQRGRVELRRSWLRFGVALAGEKNRSLSCALARASLCLPAQ